MAAENALAVRIETSRLGYSHPVRHLMLMLGLLVATAACSGKSDIGESCDTAGSTDECVDGAICTNGDTGLTCRRRCTDDSQCAATEACNGVSNTNLKSCQPKK